MTTKFEIGSIWRDVDNRFTRYIKILGFKDGRVLICTCWRDGTEAGPRTSANPDRFNGRHGGYEHIANASRTEPKASP